MAYRGLELADVPIFSTTSFYLSPLPRLSFSRDKKVLLNYHNEFESLNPFPSPILGLYAATNASMGLVEMQQVTSWLLFQ